MFYIELDYSMEELPSLDLELPDEDADEGIDKLLVAK